MVGHADALGCSKAAVLPTFYLCTEEKNWVWASFTQYYPGCETVKYTWVAEA